MPQLTGWSQHFIDWFHAKYPGHSPNFQVPETAQHIGLSEDDLKAWYDERLAGKDDEGIRFFLAEQHDKNEFLTAINDHAFSASPAGPDKKVVAKLQAAIATLTTRLANAEADVATWRKRALDMGWTPGAAAPPTGETPIDPGMGPGGAPGVS